MPLVGKAPQDTRGPRKQRDLPVGEVDRAVSESGQHDWDER